MSAVEVVQALAQVLVSGPSAPGMDGLAELLVDTRLELVGVFVGALSGALAAVRKEFDVFGVLVLAWATGLGGGMLRDVLIGATPPVGISSWTYIVTALLAGVAVLLFHPRVARNRRAVVVLDAGALGVFVLLGTMKALGMGAGPTASIVVGLLTGIGGGILRDILVSEVPLVLADRRLYAIPALLGAGLTAALWRAGWLNVATQAAVVVLVIGFRLLSLRLGWVVPDARVAGAWRRAHRGTSSGADDEAAARGTGDGAATGEREA
jgi:uncharacterized membrane protein YeiH